MVIDSVEFLVGELNTTFVESEVIVLKILTSKQSILAIYKLTI